MSAAGFAAAKLNLALHVTGQRGDGYHLLDSLVVFAGVGDHVTAQPAADLALTLSGPEAQALAPETDNLVLRAARAFAPGPGALLHLSKNLPIASGIGGGSADAAAALRVLADLWQQPLPSPAAVLQLGADVPVCLAGRACRMRGIGEQLDPLPALPPVWAVLANPRIALSTPAVFRALQRRDNPALPTDLPHWPDATALAGWLGRQRNDLQAPALALAPAIGDALAGLAALPGALLARMSGSGATCFALFADETAARAGAAALCASHPDWWLAAAPLGHAADVIPPPVSL